MDQAMLQQLQNTKEEGTIYYSHRLKKANHLDLLIYRLITLTILENDQMKEENKTTQYFYFLRSWLFALQSLHAEEKREVEDFVTNTFMENLEKLTTSLTKEEISEMLYLFPWHLRTIMITSHESQFDIINIASIAQYRSLEHFKNNGTMYFAIAGPDFHAINAIHSKVSADDTDLLFDALKKNIYSFGGALTTLSKHLDGEEALYATEDTHANVMVATLANEFLKTSKIREDLFGHLMLTLSSICFWHVELTEVEHNWAIKTGKFNFFKKHSIKKLFSRNH